MTQWVRMTFKNILANFFFSKNSLRPGDQSVPAWQPPVTRENVLASGCWRLLSVARWKVCTKKSPYDYLGYYGIIIVFGREDNERAACVCKHWKQRALQSKSPSVSPPLGKCLQTRCQNCALKPERSKQLKRAFWYNTAYHRATGSNLSPTSGRMHVSFPVTTGCL